MLTQKGHFRFYAPPTSPRVGRIIVSLIFLLNGIGLASWFTRIPAAQQKLNLTTGELGLALFGTAIGAIIMFPVVGLLIARFGSRIILTIAIVCFSASLVLPALAPNLPLLWISLAIVGAFNGMTDVSMNAQAVIVEEKYGRPIMSSFHGLWSVGSIIGAAAGGFMVAQKIDLLPHLSVTACILSMLALVVTHWLLPSPKVSAQKQEQEQKRHPLFVLPSKALLGISIISLCAGLSEGAMSDWSAIYFHSTLGTSESFAALGFASFSVAMLIGRLTGDYLVQRFGAVILIRLGGLIAAIGLGLALLINQVPLAIIGLICVGLGTASSIPLAFSIAGRATDMKPGAALASVATVTYSGFLIGPPLIGYIAEVVTLRGALWLIVALCTVIFLLSYRINHLQLPTNSHSEREMQDTPEVSSSKAGK